MGGRAAPRALAAAQRRQRRRRRLLRRLALAVVVAGVAFLGAWIFRQTRARPIIPRGAELPRFALVASAVADEAQPLTRATLAGRAVVLSFAFFHDAMHAPATLREVRALAQAVRAGPLASRVAIVTLTLAPAEDSPDHLRAVAGALGVAPPWSLASGAPDDVTALLDALDVDWRRLQAERAKYGSPIFAEDRLILVDGDGRVRGEYDATSWTAMRRLRAELDVVAAPERR